MAIVNKIHYPIHKVRQWISEGKTQCWIAETLAKELDPRVTPKLIYKLCKKHGIQCQRTGPRAAEGHPEWKGGRILVKHGYVKVYCPEHPICVATNKRREAAANGKYYRRARYVWEHRLVMENHLGRLLQPGEVVHHKNGVKDDNRLENLQLYASNALHLADDLKGRRPKWTQQGLARLHETAQRRRRTPWPSAPDAKQSTGS